jgi:hypothetical protein
MPGSKKELSQLKLPITLLKFNCQAAAFSVDDEKS